MKKKKKKKQTIRKQTHKTRLMQFALKPTFTTEDKKKKKLPILFKKIIIL